MLDLDPGMAFGTGLHPTTQLVLEALKDLARRRCRGASCWTWAPGRGSWPSAPGAWGGSVLALDVDEVAVRAAADNVAQNGPAGSRGVRGHGGRAAGRRPGARIDARGRSTAPWPTSWPG